MQQAPAEQLRWTNADLALLPDDGARYEIIAGELLASRAPHWKHQETCGIVFHELFAWAQQTRRGRVIINPGVVFSEIDSVIPDVVWSSSERLAALVDAAGHLHGAPELIVEVLSSGTQHEQRDRDAKRKLYSQHGVQEYWIVDWRLQQVAVYRRTQAVLHLAHTLLSGDTLQTPLLPDFACPIERLFPE
jgi:Uma2 family endonuclease